MLVFINDLHVKKEKQIFQPDFYQILKICYEKGNRYTKRYFCDVTLLDSRLDGSQFWNNYKLQLRALLLTKSVKNQRATLLCLLVSTGL